MDIKQSGRNGEELFRKWLVSNDLSYIYIDQTIETFSPKFKYNTKRPDFLLLLPSIGTIAVDVKHKSSWRGVFTIDKPELNKILKFSDLSLINVWYAMLDSNNNTRDKAWYWISAKNVKDAGELFLSNQARGGHFFSIPKNKFIKVTNRETFANILIQ